MAISKQFVSAIIAMIIMVPMLMLQPAEAQPMPATSPLKLYVTKVEVTGEVKLTWTKPDAMSFLGYSILRAKLPDTTFVVVDSTKNQSIELKVPAASIGSIATYAFVVVGVRAVEGPVRSNPVIVELRGLPIINAFRLDAKVEKGKVNLSWEIPNGIVVNQYSLFRISYAGMTPMMGDTIALGTTTDTFAFDTPPSVPGVPKLYSYFIKAKSESVTVTSTLAFVSITTPVLRDTVTITSKPITEAQVGKLYTYKIVAKSSDPTAVLNYFLDRNSEGMIVNQSTGEATYTPNRSGIYYAKFLVKSNMGGNARQEFTITIAKGNGILFGKVTDTLDVPVKRVLIEILKRDMNACFVYQTMSDSLGNYRFSKLDPGNYILHAIPLNGDFVEQWYDGVRDPSKATVVAVADSPAVPTTANFKLRNRFIVSISKVTVSGTVYDTTGLALSKKGTRVYFVNADFAKNTNDFRKIFQFDNTNDFRFEGNSKFVFKADVDSLGKYSTKIPQGPYISFAKSNGYSVEFYKGHGELLSADVMNLVADSAHINFTLAPLPPVLLGKISGQVLDTVKNVNVRARMVAFRDRWTIGVKDSYNIARMYFTDTDSLGNYSFAELLPGKYFILAIPLGNYAPMFYTDDTIKVQWKKAKRIDINGNSVSGINIFVKPMPDSSRGFTGIGGNVGHKPTAYDGLNNVTTVVGTPGAIIVALYATGEVAGYSVTDVNGNYNISGIAPGKYSVAVDIPGYTSSASVPATVGYDMYGNAITASASFTVDQVLGVKVQQTSTVPQAYLLEQNYPNPFNPTTTINYSLPLTGTVTLKVYNLIGQEVATLVDGLQTAGSYKATFNAERFASGVYFYKLQSEGMIHVKKMMLLK